jgi:hypothetical protein
MFKCMACHTHRNMVYTGGEVSKWPYSWEQQSRFDCISSCSPWFIVSSWDSRNCGGLCGYNRGNIVAESPNNQTRHAWQRMIISLSAGANGRGTIESGAKVS